MHHLCSGEDVGPLPESQPSLSPSQPFISSPPLPFERGPDAAVNNGARAGVQGAAGEHPPETSRSSDSGRGSDGSESDGSKSDGDRRISGLEPSESEEGSDRLGGMRSWPARPWAPPSPPPLEESLLDFEEWKRRNLAKGEKKGPLTGGGLRRDETEAQRRDENETRRFDLSEGDVGGSDEDVIEDSGRLGGGRERSSRKRRTSRRCEHEGRGDEERGKRKRFRKSSLSEQLCSSSGSGDSQRNGSVGAGGLGTGVARGAFNVGGMVYEEKNREGRFDVEEEEDCVEVPGAEGRRPLKRLKKLKVTKGETQKEGDLHGGRGGGSRPGGSGRRQGAAATGWKEFDPKDWVDWNSGDMPQEATGLNLREEEDGFANEPLGGFGIGANERAERRSSHLEGLDEEFAGEEVWGAGLGLTERNGRPFGGFDHLQRESPEAAHGRFGVSGVEQEARIADQRPVSGGHVSHSQHWEGDVTLASLPSSEHPLHLPRAAETARELSDRSDRRPRTSGGRGSQPAVKQRTLDNMWAKAGASLRDDRPPRKKRRGPPEGFAAARHAQATAGGYGGATRVHQTNATRGDPAKTPPGSKTPLPVKTPQQSGIARKLALLSPGGEVACAICWEARASAEQGVLPCGHGFCYHCVIKWAKVGS